MRTFTKDITNSTTLYKDSFLTLIHNELSTNRKVIIWKFPYQIISLPIILYDINKAATFFSLSVESGSIRTKFTKK